MNIEEARSILQDIRYTPEYTFHATIDGRGEMYLQGMYDEADIFTGVVETQYTRRWFISPDMSKSEFVQTVLKCILTSHEHRAREHFTYRGRLVYGPHFDIDVLWQAAAQPLAKREP